MVSKKNFQRFSKVCFLMTYYYLYLLFNIFVSKFGNNINSYTNKRKTSPLTNDNKL